MKPIEAWPRGYFAGARDSGIHCALGPPRMEVRARVLRVHSLLARPLALQIVQHALLAAHRANALSMLLRRELLGVLDEGPEPAHAQVQYLGNSRSRVSSESKWSKEDARPARALSTVTMRAVGGRKHGMPGTGGLRNLKLWGPRTPPAVSSFFLITRHLMRLYIPAPFALRCVWYSTGTIVLVLVRYMYMFSLQRHQTLV